MSQRNSEYDLVPGDLYCTPEWVTEALLSVEVFPRTILEPAVGEGHMHRPLVARYGRGSVMGLDINLSGYDFLKSESKIPWGSIVTNPPGYSRKKGETVSLAERFVRHALDLTKPASGKVAMLLPLAWDTANSRRDLFDEHPAFKIQHVLTKRIRWANLPQKKNGPSQNHAWFVWDWSHEGPHLKGYLP